MNINTIFLVGLALVEFGIIIYLLFKVDNFQRKVKEVQEKILKYLEDEMLKTSVLTKQETPKVEEKPVDKVVEKLRKRKK